MRLDFSLPRQSRLARSKDIREVIKTGQKLVTTSLVIYWRRIDGQGLKACFIVSRRIGKAVLRNRVKRYLRESFRAEKQSFGQDVWLVFIIKRVLEKEELNINHFRQAMMDVTCKIKKKN